MGNSELNWARLFIVIEKEKSKFIIIYHIYVFIKIFFMPHQWITLLFRIQKRNMYNNCESLYLYFLQRKTNNIQNNNYTEIIFDQDRKSLRPKNLYLSNSAAQFIINNPNVRSIVSYLQEFFIIEKEKSIKKFIIIYQIFSLYLITESHW